jgi:hypothetical protein
MDASHTIHPSYTEHADVAHADPNQGRRRTDAARHASEEQDDLLPARGVAVSVLIGAGLWAIILTAGWLIFR